MSRSRCRKSDVVLLPEGDFEDVRDEVGLDAVVFAEARAGAGGVEVAEGDEAQAVDLVMPSGGFSRR